MENKEDDQKPVTEVSVDGVDDQINEIV